MERLTFTRLSLSDVRVIMVIMCVLVEELQYQVMIGTYGYILSGLALNGIAIRGPQLSGHLPDTWDTPGRGYRGPGCMPC
jgi:hypothetical protein